MTQSPYLIDDTSHSTESELWEYALTPGYFGGRTLRDLSQAPLRLAYWRLESSKLVELALSLSDSFSNSEWEEGRAYQEDPPTRIHHHLEWRVTINNREVSQDTEENLTLDPSSF
ncbi:hypothetical protein N7509_000203 [Penicillium cosmopolitanum]|uniref:Uncharacterized protein n=1 Tax=Penicillium cosmopolitanum TaxID=1131564 RepID=A0A9W9WCX8_9EURO|nr:uncharacterized protein N7509_000203 [Penicillium cosmopolitanum]KAJ5414869.1 hypothetical protein N7509_000203 [Penicillium cosmopolitanum]